MDLIACVNPASKDAIFKLSLVLISLHFALLSLCLIIVIILQSLVHLLTLIKWQMEKANMLWQSADLILAELSAKMAINLVALRLPAVFLASIVLVWSASCLPWIACLVTFAGKMTLAILVAAVVAVVFKKPLARLLTPLDQRQRISPRGKAVFITGCDTGFG